MSTTAIASAILMLLSGIGIFLIAIQMMSSNLESASSKKLKNLFGKASGSKLLGVGIGTIGTAAIQSSGATTVMTIGFVNAGILTLSQAATIIYGANIGTTVTAQIVALGMFGEGGISTSVIFSSLAGVGALMAMFAKNDAWKTAGGILTGFGMMFVGLTLMSDSMSDFAKLEGVRTFLAGVSNPILLVLLGAVFTAIIQSSSVMTSIALAMVVTSLITLDQGIYLTMGSNIGSCIVAILAGMASGTNARRTALIHLIFNCSGVVVFLIAGMILGIASSGRVDYGVLFERMFPGAPQTQLAMFHTFFNVLTVAFMLPLTDALVRLVCRMVPEKAPSSNPDAPRLHFVDETMLKYPPVAVQQTKREIVRMSELAMENVDRSLDMICTLDFSQEEQFNKTEEEINFINRSLISFVVRLTDGAGINEHDHVYLSGTFRTVRDLERIGDYAENIVEYSEALRAAGQGFSDDALYEISQLRVLIHRLYGHVMQAYRHEDLDALEQANDVEEQIDDYTKLMEDHHIERLSKHICTPVVGAQFLSLSSNLERIADHLINVGKTIRSLKQ